VQKSCSNNERKFIENFCALGYFKIPDFRNKIIECIMKTNDPVLSEWRGTEFKLEENEDI